MTDDDQQIFTNQLGKLPGWGENENGVLSEVMKDASIPIVDRDVCKQSNRDFFHMYLGDNDFCAGFANGK